MSESTACPWQHVARGLLEAIAKAVTLGSPTSGWTAVLRCAERRSVRYTFTLCSSRPGTETRWNK
ncbi:hypothetical protein ANANG_G00200880 [Anguilla anguilla]|uniref:Uncharacterized protein n=1 Tax=Anguilla anguilla TaxID=7936 RepID=A0A9D3LXV4_ANGAN|nr:hypothetical protein ANANG_G00200880 [Anguilla anguilla]